jgi:fatty-acyl-CoA synthase
VGSADAVAVEAVDSPVQYTYAALDVAACRVAHWAAAQGLVQGDVVRPRAGHPQHDPTLTPCSFVGRTLQAALMMENRPDYLAVTMGLAKCGVTVALLNTSLSGTLLAHAVTVAAAKHVVVSAAQEPAWQTAATLLVAAVAPRVSVFEALDLAAYPAHRPPRAGRSAVKPRDPLYYIYTSGTTGPSKAALFSVRTKGPPLPPLPASLCACARVAISLSLSVCVQSRCGR